MQAGGQPGHRAAWLAAEANALTGGYFRATLPTLDQAWMRPRYAGYDPFQDAAAELVHGYLAHGGDARAAVERINAAYRDSVTG